MKSSQLICSAVFSVALASAAPLALAGTSGPYGPADANTGNQHDGTYQQDGTNTGGPDGMGRDPANPQYGTDAQDNGYGTEADDFEDSSGHQTHPDE